jgi:predicted transcriptional regulator
MTYKISLPRLGGKFSVKDSVVNILSIEQPLTANEIFNRVKKQGKSTTYQAVHKATMELLKEGLLEKQAKAYIISPTYIKDIKDFGAKLDSLYQKKGKDMLNTLEKKGHILLEFDKQIEMGRFLIDFIKDTCEGEDNVYLLWRYLWCPLTFSEREFQALKVMCEKIKPIVLTSASEKTPIEKKFGEMWQKIGMEVRFDMEISPFFETILYKDMVIEVMFPSDIEELRFKERKKSLEELNFTWFYNHILSESGTVYMSIRKNKRLTDECKRHVDYLLKTSSQ